MAGSLDPFSFSRSKTALSIESPITEQGNNEFTRYPRSCLPFYDKRAKEAFMVPGPRELVFLYHNPAAQTPLQAGPMMGIKRLKLELEKYPNTKDMITGINRSLSSNPLLMNNQTYSLLNPAQFNYMKVRQANDEMIEALGYSTEAEVQEGLASIRDVDHYRRTPRVVFSDLISFDGVVFEHGTETSSYQQPMSTLGGKIGKQVNVTLIQDGQVDTYDYCDEHGVTENSGLHMVLRRFKYPAGVKVPFVFATENHLLQTPGASYSITPVADLYVVQIAFMCHPSDNHVPLDQTLWAANESYDGKILRDGCTQLLGSVFFANKSSSNGNTHYKPPHTPETIRPVQNMINIGFNKRPLNLRLHVGPL
jgi:hypothetical protein